jgi:hypothetical protein
MTCEKGDGGLWADRPEAPEIKRTRVNEEPGKDPLEFGGFK